MKGARRILGHRRFRWLKRCALFVRGILFIGRRYNCPCCGWTFRSFVDKSRFFKKTTDGCCPRCNSKARHRRDWLFLEERTSFFVDDLSVLEIAPWWSFGRRFCETENIRYLAIDIDPGAPFVAVAGDVTAIPALSSRFDALVCIHVLEHVDDDRKAIQEIHRVLKPGGWALITVPLLLDEPTREDPSITSPEERQRLFGEKGHVRYYGRDLGDRLRSAGLHVTFEPAADIPPDRCLRYGLRKDENIFLCRKPAVV